ncbi:long-chain fatty acid-CoA ligase [Modicella reniformis]|uniref:Long-chain fatty acid-CoA ligase n=1 Tax=Modicella reniformis TaxID=1440133 RepID=A0A9P6IVS7_9FUNG|nr:long-chain fatty acid-CoA ligase [Modicella reniformis]
MEPRNGKYAVEYDEVHHIYRNVMATGGLLDKPEIPQYKNLGGRTLAHLFDFMANEYEDKDLMGWRNIIKTHRVEKPSTNAGNKSKSWIKYELSDYQWMSYRTAKDDADHIGLGIKKLGIQKGDFVLVFASTW